MGGFLKIKARLLKDKEVIFQGDGISALKSIDELLKGVING